MDHGRRARMARIAVRLSGAVAVAILFGIAVAAPPPTAAEVVDPIILTPPPPPPVRDGDKAKDRDRPVAMGISVPLPPPS